MMTNVKINSLLTDPFYYYYYEIIINFSFCSFDYLWFIDQTKSDCFKDSFMAFKVKRVFFFTFFYW